MIKAIFSSVLVLLLSLSIGLYQFRLKEIINSAGAWRVIEPTVNRHCASVAGLTACEKIILHQPTGLLYLACSDPALRSQWLPRTSNLNAENRSLVDYVAVYDPATGESRRLDVVGFGSVRGMSLHGMDVVVSSLNPDEVFIYLVNHRPPVVGNPREVGPDEAVEVFRSRVGGGEMRHVHTFEDPTMISLNDVNGSPDGKSVYFTNDAALKVGLMNEVYLLLHMKRLSIGYCHQDRGCKVAIDRLKSNNGIAKSPTNDTFYVASTVPGGITVLSRQADDSLVLDDEIVIDHGLDNLSVDYDGVVWAAGIPKLLLMNNHINDPTRLAPSSIFRVSINMGESSFFGEKYQVQKVLEDDGTLISGATTVVHDARRKKLFIHGVASSHLTVCDLEK